MKVVKHQKRKFFILAFLSLLVSAPILHAQVVNVEEAKKQGRVVVYGMVRSQSMDKINKPFERKYGIKVEYWRGPPHKVLDRALTEWRAGRAAFDVVEATRAAQLIMKQEGLFARFVPVTSERFPDQFKEKDGLITPWRFVPMTILYNTELVRGPNIPKKLEDLLDTRWKKKLTMADPTAHTTTAEFLQNLEKIMGPAWLGFVEALAKQQPHLVASFAPVPDVIIRGEAHAGIALVKYVKQFKGPIGYVMLDKFLAVPNYMGLSGKGPNPDAGRLYIEYATSPEGQKLMADDGEFVLSPGVYPDIRDAEKVVARTIFTDPPTDEEFKRLREDFRKIFFGK